MLAPQTPSSAQAPDWAVHAGWRSLAGQGGVGVLECVYPDFSALSPVHTEPKEAEVMAWLGPCIGPDAFEVGSEVRDAFMAHDPQAQSMFVPHVPGKWFANLQGLARLRLAALGVTRIYGNDGSRKWCTVSNPSRFFSHRRDQAALGGSGRMAASIWLA